jgi:hypothetical protein
MHCRWPSCRGTSTASGWRAQASSRYCVSSVRPPAWDLGLGVGLTARVRDGVSLPHERPEGRAESPESPLTGLGGPGGEARGRLRASPTAAGGGIGGGRLARPDSRAVLRSPSRGGDGFWPWLTRAHPSSLELTRAYSSSLELTRAHPSPIPPPRSLPPPRRPAAPPPRRGRLHLIGAWVAGPGLQGLDCSR